MRGEFFDLTNVSFSIFTGDILSHDNDDQVLLFCDPSIGAWLMTLGLSGVC
jgi:hypothetical protein